MQRIVMELLIIGSPLNAHRALELDTSTPMVPQRELRVAAMAGLENSRQSAPDDAGDPRTRVPFHRHGPCAALRAEGHLFGFP